MTTVADDKKRVTIRTARPGDRFDVQVSGDKIVLTRLEPAASRAAKVKIRRRGRYSVGVLERPVDERALRDALSDFP
jgi:phage FluMu protein gp41